MFRGSNIIQACTMKLARFWVSDIDSIRPSVQVGDTARKDHLMQMKLKCGLEPNLAGYR